LENAKKLLKRFDFILDQSCLTENIGTLAKIMNWKYVVNKKHKEHKSNKERIPTQELYDYIVEKNKFDLELYEWTKTQSLIKCDS
jgi:hypothetical protein